MHYKSNSDSSPLAIQPASPQQEGIWLHMMAHCISYWNFVDARTFSGVFNQSSWETALENLFARHSALRTTFRFEAESLFQLIHERVDVQSLLTIDKDLSNDLVQMNVAIQSKIREFAKYEFSLADEPLLRCSILCSDNSYTVILLISHIIADNTSLLLVWRELVGLYNDLIDNKPVNQMVNKRQYYDYCIEQQLGFGSADYLERKKLWSSKFDKILPTIKLNLYNNVGNAHVYFKRFSLQPQLIQKLKGLALSNKVIYSSVYQLAYFLLLYKYCGNPTLLVGNIISGRGFGTQVNRAVIGLFASRVLNTLTISPTDTVGALLSKVNREIVSSFENADISYEDLVRTVTQNSPAIGASLAIQAAFNVIKKVQSKFPENQIDQFNSFLHEEQVQSVGNLYDIYLTVVDGVDNADVQLELKCEMPYRQLVSVMLDSYVNILERVISDYKVLISEFCFQTEADAALISKFNATSTTIDSASSIQSMFSRQAIMSPMKVALEFDEFKVTYKELDYLSDAAAHWFLEQGVTPKTHVGLNLRREPLLFVCLLGLLKAGASYLPLDHEYPQERLSFMVIDSGATLIITDNDSCNGLNRHAQIIHVDNNTFLNNRVAGALNDFTTPDSDAYVIYTSGSTGIPKGVVVKHLPLINLIQSFSSLIPFANEKTYCLTTICFDIFFIESVLPLCCGGTVVIASYEAQASGFEASKEITEKCISIAQMTPSRLRLFFGAKGDGFLNGLKTLILGGEMFPSDLYLKLKRSMRGRIFNVYGPTESTVWSTVKDLTDDSFITIGKPIRNTQVHILNESNHEVGIGVCGEIIIAGLGVAGYITATDELQGKFFQFKDARAYRTGDIGRWLPSGELEVFGRNDDQIKLRGYRIEPKEIERWLLNHPELTNAVVLPVSRFGYDELFAFYTSTHDIREEDIIKYLRDCIPRYAIPSFFIKLSQFPLTLNEKIDKPALRSQINDYSLSQQETPGVNEEIVRIWSNYIQCGLGQPVAQSNFFESGGHSLNAVRLLNQLENDLNISVPIKEFFQFPTLQFLHQKYTDHYSQPVDNA